MKKFAIILSGCGHLDGTEIREAVSAFIALDILNVHYHCFAPDIEFIAIDHIMKDSVGSRNIMSESGRIARGDISDLKHLNVDEFQGLVIPGGYGVAKNLSNFAKEGKAAEVLPELQTIVEKFFKQGKPIGAICIAPVILALSLGKKTKLMLTLGENENADIINTLGCVHVYSKSEDYVKDKVHKIFSTSAYMREDRLHLIYKGIFKMIEAMVNI